MTYKEKLALFEPERLNDSYMGGCQGCPDDIEMKVCPFGTSSHENCTKCWNREIPGTTVSAPKEFIFKHIEPLEEKPKNDICFCYRDDKRCMGTKEIDPCKCGGDETKCDFYPEIRDRATRTALENPLTKDELEKIADKMTHEYLVSADELREIFKRQVRVICISGKAQHGKDTTAGYLKEALEERGKRVLIVHYGDLVKYVCKTFFDWNGLKDEVGRTLLQYVGTDVIRARTPDYWVDFVLSVLDHFPDKWDYVLIPDCRFPNEIDRARSAGWNTTHIRVVRGGDFISPLTEEQQKHPSETALDNVKPDFLVFNCGTLEFLKKYVYEMASYLEDDTCTY